MPIPKEFKTNLYPSKGITVVCMDGLVYKYEKEVKVTKTVTKKVHCIAIYARNMSHLDLPHGIYIEDVPFAALCRARMSYFSERYSQGHIPKGLTENPAGFYITLEDGTVLDSALFESGLTIGNANKMHGHILTIDELLGYHSDSVITYDSRKEES